MSRVTYPKHDAIAASTSFAVEEVFAATHATDAAVDAVKLLLRGVVVEKIALVAKICPKMNATVCAALGHRLSLVTHRTYDLLHLRPL
jgi:hypothetical protein